MKTLKTLLLILQASKPDRISGQIYTMDLHKLFADNLCACLVNAGIASRKTATEVNEFAFGGGVQYGVRGVSFYAIGIALV